MKYNLCLVFSPDMEYTLVIKKIKGPYPGLLNAPGGKIEPNEPVIDSVLREVKEETGYTYLDGSFCHMMEIKYPSGIELSIWYMKLLKGVDTEKESWETEEGIMWWMDSDSIIYDQDRDKYAGDGNLLYFIQCALTMEGIKI